MNILGRGQHFELVDHEGWEYIRRRKGRGVVVVVTVTRSNEIVFVEQYRYPIRRRVIEYPAGVIADENEDETPRRAARRELLEEAGFDAVRLQKLFSGPSAGGSSNEWLHFYLALDAERVKEGGGVEDEDITVYTVPQDGVDAWLKRMQRRGRAVDPKIYAGLYMVRVYNTAFLQPSTQTRTRLMD